MEKCFNCRGQGTCTCTKCGSTHQCEPCFGRGHFDYQLYEFHDEQGYVRSTQVCTERYAEDYAKAKKLVPYIVRKHPDDPTYTFLEKGKGGVDERKN